MTIGNSRPEEKDLEAPEDVVEEARRAVPSARFDVTGS
jgi:hypothetical protein